MSHGHILDGIRYFFSSPSSEVIACWPDDTYILDTDIGKIRIKDTGGNKPTLVMVPDGPCVIEHFEYLINELQPFFRVICFDMPGLGYSYPKLSYDFGLEKSTKVIISVMDALKIERAILSFSCSNSFIAIAVAKYFPERVSRLVLAQTPSIHEMKNQWTKRNVPKPIQIPYIVKLLMRLCLKKWLQYGTTWPCPDIVSTKKIL